MFCGSTTRFRLLAPLTFICAVLGVMPASAGDYVDNCGTEQHKNYAPHCVDQFQLCAAYGEEVVNICNIYATDHYRDPRDIGSMLASMRSQQPVAGELLGQLVDKIIAYKDSGKSLSGGHVKRIYEDCIGGTLDFLDNEGLQ
jgi:hypothetical protein